LLSVAAGIAAARGIKDVFYAAHSGDWSIYPDCRKDYFELLKATTSLSTLWHPVELHAPFIEISKADIMKMGIDLNVPYEFTWSCYQGEERPCGVCPTCVERIEAFHLNGLEDPLML
jgi:7-cyano-7-deazaguanine synthase